MGIILASLCQFLKVSSPEIMDKMAAKSQLLCSIDHAEHIENYSKCMNDFQKIALISIWDLFCSRPSSIHKDLSAMKHKI